MSGVETRRAHEATRNAGDSVAKCQEPTATVYDVELQTVKEMQWICEAFNERSDLVATRVVFLKAIHEINQSISDSFRIKINSILLHNFPKKSSASPLQLVGPPQRPKLWKPLPYSATPSSGRHVGIVLNVIDTV
jgi:hypothetical protein